MENFYDNYKDYTKDQLFKILTNKDEYQQEAVDAATYFLRKNSWDTELDSLLTKEQQEYETEVAEKAEYYGKEVEFRKDNNYYFIRPTEADTFEARLTEANIEYFKMDNDADLFKIPYPAVVFYFKNKDTEAVDKLCVELGLETHINPDTKPFLKMQSKVALIFVIVIVIILIFNMLSCY
jgi:hypothetical protein